MAKRTPKQTNFSPEKLNSLICASLNAIDDWCEAGEGRTEWPPEMVETLCLRSMLLADEMYGLISYIVGCMPGLVKPLRKQYESLFAALDAPA